jgi:hypothetical protein
MKKLFPTSLAVSAALVLGGAAFLATGCHKKEDTIAKIYVRDTDNNPVAGAEVVLKGESTLPNTPAVVLFDTTYTNGSGEAIFNFNDEYQLGQAGVAVLNIEASYGDASGQGIIKVEQETTSEETVYIQP